MAVECLSASIVEKGVHFLHHHHPHKCTCPILSVSKGNLIVKSNMVCKTGRGECNYACWALIFFSPNQPSPGTCFSLPLFSVGYLVLQETALPAASSSLLLKW